LSFLPFLTPSRRRRFLSDLAALCLAQTLRSSLAAPLGRLTDGLWAGILNLTRSNLTDAFGELHYVAGAVRRLAFRHDGKLLISPPYLYPIFKLYQCQRAEALASLVSTARSYLIHRS
jgi:hypothetical protein